MDRRKFLMQVGALGCTTAASPLVTPMAFASGPWDNRLVVIVLRGAMDGLDVVQPYGDRNLQDLRRTISVGPDGGAFDLDGYFAMHAGMADLMPLWQAGDLGFVQAVSTPYRDRRSHFDGQDILETGGADLSGGLRDGWLNRLLQVVPGAMTDTAFAVGREQMLILKGEAPFSSWSPEAKLGMSPETLRLIQKVQEGDPLFEQASAEAVQLAQVMAGRDPEEAAVQTAMSGLTLHGDHVQIAEFAAARLLQDTRIASFSISGWDTHGSQKAAMNRPLSRLADTLRTLQVSLGSVWDKTAVVCMTEFGRTARENGSGGTDHGTGGVMIYAGWALRGGQVLGDWPGLSEGALYADRDVMPTRDVRAHAGWVIRGILGLNQGLIEQALFPDLDMGPDTGIMR